MGSRAAKNLALKLAKKDLAKNSHSPANYEKAMTAAKKAKVIGRGVGY